ncbi:class I SAM-dependent methyltransferase [Aliiroseovarius sp. S1339]|uniref:class I SAM-dependent methyltransferase n=1 Tax=Aliiroseovarius sp. S1339 TaxID=2936990 RepID=UPI0020BE936E|nr:class I SAM-dependent methyltransferase [Aliiroseovarius sp. S1339]MCK8464200.1 class I SAM-dependent methyltransferase [Aliiroseovarius sp. S1339]
MAYDYDKLYAETPAALGEPAPVFLKFFQQLESTDARVLDLGCGQGRDALPIARLGHRVVGVDLSPNGIKELSEIADREKLRVDGVVADLRTYQPDGLFDVVLIDRTLHMLAEEPRLLVLERMLDHVAARGWVLIADETSNIDGFKRVLSDHQADWQPDLDKRGYLFVRRA